MQTKFRQGENERRKQVKELGQDEGKMEAGWKNDRQ
jgi:hypothetical protein